ncbi:hypothetical protein SAZ10_04125 [Mesorhizobium sp. BAC0120]|nr:hypothetical protein [Mesorhizobium sp. BAC0120]MDW6020944.1 hypothetical protein [Mesorhizobium sp. BAC0120]
MSVANEKPGRDPGFSFDDRNALGSPAACRKVKMNRRPVTVNFY